MGALPNQVAGPGSGSGPADRQDGPGDGTAPAVDGAADGEAEGATPYVNVTVDPGATCVPEAGSVDRTRPTWPGSVVVCGTVVNFKPDCVNASSAP
jgi:hypothetical protein